MRRNPLISIITITLNDLAGLQYTVRTVEAQTYENFEHLVVDGASSDGTIEFCANIAQRHSYFSYISGKDQGIYDAMNKGARMAHGDLLVFLNSSDGLTDPTVLDFVAKKWREFEDWQWGYGAARFIDSMRVPFWGQVQPPFDRKKFYLGQQHIPHPACYVGREFFLEHGAFDESFGTAADQEFFVRVSKNYPPAVWIKFLADFTVGGVSSEETTWGRATVWHQMRVKNGVMIGNNRQLDRIISISLAFGERLANAIRKPFRSNGNFSSVFQNQQLQ